MTRKKKILTAIAIVLVGIQFIRPARNNGEADTAQDITHAVPTPPDVKNILVTSCYDCHSNHTNHMWYENIQPLGWWIAHHIDEGRQKLNFSEFNSYTPKRKQHKLEEVAETVEQHEMPLSSYLVIHQDAKLSADQQKKLTDWVHQNAPGLFHE